MKKDYDAIIIGAGIIGASIAFELAKKGYRTLNVDKLSAAGAGSTAGQYLRHHPYALLDARGHGDGLRELPALEEMARVPGHRG